MYYKYFTCKWRVTPETQVFVPVIYSYDFLPHFSDNCTFSVRMIFLPSTARARYLNRLFSERKTNLLRLIHSLENEIKSYWDKYRLQYFYGPKILRTHFFVSWKAFCKYVLLLRICHVVSMRTLYQKKAVLWGVPVS